MSIRRLFFAVLPLFAAFPAWAQTGPHNCGPREDVIAGLAVGWGESRQSLAMGPNSTVVETFASAETGTWTITVTTPDGTTCLVASGQSYQAVDEPLPPPGKDS